MLRKVFLLSPASLNGIRARQMMSPRAKFPTAQRFRSADGVEIAEAFAFMSALYFRGKIAYARRFGDLVLVMAPGFGLVPEDWKINEERMDVMRRIPVDVTSRRYVETLRSSAELVASHLAEDGEAVLLGSVASGKYVDVLQPVFGRRLVFPAIFAGLGDMSRGGLMLRAARAGQELEYTTLDAPRHSKDAVARAREMSAKLSA